MKVIHLSMSAGGGAGIAASRTVRSLRGAGIDAELWTVEGGELGPALRRRRWMLLRVLFDSWPTRRYHDRALFSAWSNNQVPSRLAARVNEIEADIVHLHWVGSGFLSLGELAKFAMPVVWTLHDMWAFTGGCHYSAGCDRFRGGCGRCPQLGSADDRDLSHRNWRRKRGALVRVAAFVTPSQWLGTRLIESGAAEAERVHVIANGLDLTLFDGVDREVARAKLGLSGDKLVFVAGAQDLAEPRKGTSLLPEVMARIASRTKKRCVLLLFGANSLGASAGEVCEVRSLGTVREGRDVAEICSAADGLLLPSLQDNLPNLAVEAQACGCPVIGFDSGGLSEIIEDGRTGKLAAAMNADALGDAVLAWLSSAPDPHEVRARCRERALRAFSLSSHAARMKALYATLPVTLRRKP